MTETVTPPRIVAWEITRGCNLACAHCRASAEPGPYPGELTTAECFSVVDQLAEFGKPMLILTGGEPLQRADFLDIANYASGKGLRVTVGCNGTLLTREIAAAMKKVPVARVAISLDFPQPELQDKFRGKAGAFHEAVAGLKYAREAGLQTQVNTTVTRMNVQYLDELLALALELGAVAFHPFLLVPTGRGKGLEKEELPPEEYERILRWICQKQVDLGERIFLKPTDAPHYMRIRNQYQRECGVSLPVQRHGHPGGMGMARGMLSLKGLKQVLKGHPGSMGMMTRGCLAGTGFCFISHVGQIQGCGYLDISAGSLKSQSFKEIWEGSRLFQDIRDLSMLKGKCGQCEYKKICGGCRARAFETTGDYLEEEPYCIYQPRKRKSEQGAVTA